MKPDRAANKTSSDVNGQTLRANCVRPSVRPSVGPCPTNQLQGSRKQSWQAEFGQIASRQLGSTNLPGSSSIRFSGVHRDTATEVVTIPTARGIFLLTRRSPTLPLTGSSAGQECQVFRKDKCHYRLQKRQKIAPTLTIPFMTWTSIPTTVYAKVGLHQGLLILYSVHTISKHIS